MASAAQHPTKHQSSSTTTKSTSQAMRPVAVNPEIVPTLPPMSSTAANLQLLNKAANANANENKNGGSVLQGPPRATGTTHNSTNMGLVGGDSVPKLPSAKMLIKKALINNKGGNTGTGTATAAGPGLQAA